MTVPLQKGSYAESYAVKALVAIHFECGGDSLLADVLSACRGRCAGRQRDRCTDPTGAFTIDSGWFRQRGIRPEDIEATIYSALGIDWTIRNDDPLGRGFEYVPEAAEDLYGPKWTSSGVSRAANRAVTVEGAPLGPAMPEAEPPA